MSPENVKAAEAEAKRFLARLAAYRKVVGIKKDGDYEWFDHAPKESGALRRASLDLTRALAAMRKP